VLVEVGREATEKTAGPPGRVTWGCGGALMTCALQVRRAPESCVAPVSWTSAALKNEKPA